MTEFRRRQNSDRWHWCKECPDYPKEKDVLISHNMPEYGDLCEDCKKREPLKMEEKK